MTALLAVAVERKVPTRREAAALLVLCGGVMLTVWEGLAGSAAGIALCLAGTVRLPGSACSPAASARRALSHEMGARR